MNCVLLTGVTGLIGAAVARRMPPGDDGVRIAAVTSTTDLCQPGMAASIIERFKPQYVVHCAGKLGGIGAQQADPSMPIINSLVMGAHVIDATAKAGAKLVFLSSSTVYPMRHDGSAVALESWPRIPELAYRGVGGMKIYLEDLIDFYAEKYLLKATILRPTAVYGPFDRGFHRDGHVIPDLLRRADAGELPLTVWGRPDVVRDFVFVDDVADAILDVLDHEAWGHVFNVGSGEQTPISELAFEVLRTVYGPETLAALEDRMSAGPLRFDANQPTAIPFRAVSVDHIRSVLGWVPKVTLDAGLEKTLAWWRMTQAATQGGHA